MDLHTDSGDSTDHEHDFLVEAGPRMQTTPSEAVRSMNINMDSGGSTGHWNQYGPTEAAPPKGIKMVRQQHTPQTST